MSTLTATNLPQPGGRNLLRPSVDSIYDLLSGLDDSQAEDLLRDLNHTAPSNVPVAEGIDFFEGPCLPENNASASSRSTRRRTTFIKSVSTFDLRSSSGSSSERAGRTPNPNSPASPEPPLPTTTTTTTTTSGGGPRARSASAVHREDDEEARRKKDQQFKTPRAYKRISRPWATLAPPSSGGPDLRDLWAAYLSGPTPQSPLPSPSASYASSSASFSSADSPATPRSAAASSLFSPVVAIAPMEMEMELELDSPSLADLLEPSPSRTAKPRFGAAAPGRPACPVSPYSGGDNISGIFEVLSRGS